MSQYGAQGAARLGCTHAQILAAYYAGTTLRRTPLTAPVELTLATAKRVTMDAESTPATWIGAGRSVTQPARTSWTVATAGGRTTVSTSTGAQPLHLGPGASLQIQHAGSVVRLRTFSSLTSTVATLDLRLRQGTLTMVTSASAVTLSETITGTSTARAVDRYLWGLGEVPASWPQEALRAQVDAARTYLTHSYDPRRRRYVIGVTSADQVYRGAAQEDADAAGGSAWRAAVTATRDEVIVDRAGRPIWAMYSSSGGGRSESRAYVYGSQSGYGYLVGLDDSRWDLASDNPRRSWARAFDPTDFARRLGFSSVSAASIAGLGSPGRASGLIVTGLRGGRRATMGFTGDQVRAKLGLLSPVITVAWAVGRQPTSPSAAPAGPRLSGPKTSAGCTGTACGSATARFSGATSLVEIRETIQDRSCNRRLAYVRLLVRYTNGRTQLTGIRYASSRCRARAVTYGGLSWRSGSPIAGFAVVVGERGGRVTIGRYQDNPNS